VKYLKKIKILIFCPNLICNLKISTVFQNLFQDLWTIKNLNRKNIIKNNFILWKQKKVFN
jgi:hypothetical protein